MSSGEQFLSTQEVAQLLGVSDRSVLNYVERGELEGEPVIRGKQRLWRFRKSAVELLVEQQNRSELGTPPT